MSEKKNGVQTRTQVLTTKGIRSVLLGLMGNASLVVIKGMAAIIGNSHAMLADAMESLLDIFQGLVVLGGLRIAAVEPDEDHPYGHGKAEPLAAIVVSIGLFGAGLGIAFTSIQQLVRGEYHGGPAPWTLGVIVIVIIVKELLFRHIDSVGESIGSTSVRADAWHHRSDAITSAAAFIGILIAVAGGEGYEAADNWAALLACVVICYNGYLLLRPALSEVMDAAPVMPVEAHVRTVAREVEGVTGLHICLVRKMGFDYYVDLHVLVDGDMPVRAGHAVAHRVKDAIRDREPRIRDVLIHIEPDDKIAEKPFGKKPRNRPHG